MKCQYCKAVKLTSKNRHSKSVIDVDTKQVEVLLLCPDCFSKLDGMEKDGKARAEQNKGGLFIATTPEFKAVVE